jgi:hypothetical protein
MLTTDALPLSEQKGFCAKDRVLHDIRAQVLARVPTRWTLKDLAAQEFAAINGWRACRSLFPLSRLAKPCSGRTLLRWWPCDHALAFKEGRKAAAFVTQPYPDQDPQQTIAEVGRVADIHGLTLHLPPGGVHASIHYPGRTLFLVMTRPGVVVRWLPEQQTAWDAHDQ